jgi:hypothetical protein
LLAVHWSRIGDVLNQAGDLSGKAIVGCSLPMNAEDTELVVAHTSSGAARSWRIGSSGSGTRRDAGRWSWEAGPETLTFTTT